VSHDVYSLPPDPQRRLGSALGLPTLEIAGFTLYKRITLVAEDARGQRLQKTANRKGGQMRHDDSHPHLAPRIVKVFYPVFPPDANAGDVLRWLQSR